MMSTSMPARRPKYPPPAVAVFGWYAAVVLPDPARGGTTPGMVPREAQSRAFWAAWWTEDPRRAKDADPDAYGFVVGGKALGEAVGAAYDALRKARGPKVYDISIGDTYAVAAFREGAPRQRAVETDFEALALEGLQELGLGESATLREIRAAFQARHPDHGGKPGEDIHRLTTLFNAAVARRKRLDEEQTRADIRVGKVPRRKLRRPRKSNADGDAGGMFGRTTSGARAPTMETLAEDVRTVALKVRARAEQVAPAMDRGLGRGPVTADLAGFCEVGSLGLVAALKEASIEARLAHGRLMHRAHTWVEVPLPETEPGVDPGVLYIDITATQMGPTWPRVVVIDKSSSRWKHYERRLGGAEVEAGVVAVRQSAIEQLPPRWWSNAPEPATKAAPAPPITIVPIGAPPPPDGPAVRKARPRRAGTPR